MPRMLLGANGAFLEAERALLAAADLEKVRDPKGQSLSYLVSVIPAATYAAFFSDEVGSLLHVAR